jgi:hypothetical protein
VLWVDEAVDLVVEASRGLLNSCAKVRAQLLRLRCQVCGLQVCEARLDVGFVDDSGLLGEAAAQPAEAFG